MSGLNGVFKKKICILYFENYFLIFSEFRSIVKYTACIFFQSMSYFNFFKMSPAIKVFLVFLCLLDECKQYFFIRDYIYVVFLHQPWSDAVAF